MSGLIMVGEKGRFHMRVGSKTGTPIAKKKKLNKYSLTNWRRLWS